MTQTRKWSVLTAVVVVLVLVAGWFLLVSPQRSEAADLTAQAEGVTAENQLLETQIATLQAQQKQLPKWQAELAAIRDQLPPSPSLPSLIRTLSNEADRAGVELTSLTPNTPVVIGVPSATTGLVPGQLAGLDVQLQVSGGYFEVQQFVNNLERMTRVMLVTGLNLAEGGDETDTSGTLSSTVSGRVFLVPPGEVTTTGTTATTSTTTGTTPASE